MTKGENKTILLLEDEHEMRTALVNALIGRLPDAQILSAGTVPDLEQQLALADGGTMVNVIIADQVFGQRTVPNSDPQWGIRFLRAAKQKHPDAVRILVSAQTNLAETQTLLDEGLVHHLQAKRDQGRIVCDELAEKVQRILEGDYSVLNVKPYDAWIRTSLAEAIARMPKGQRTKFYTVGGERDVSEIANDPKMLQRFTHSVLRGRTLALAEMVRRLAASPPDQPAGA